MRAAGGGGGGLGGGGHGARQVNAAIQHSAESRCTQCISAFRSLHTERLLFRRGWSRAGRNKALAQVSILHRFTSSGRCNTSNWSSWFEQGCSPADCDVNFLARGFLYTSVTITEVSLLIIAGKISISSISWQGVACTLPNHRTGSLLISTFWR